jgi:TRAP-type C4-dicarboxylate transport system permease small subunit
MAPTLEAGGHVAVDLVEQALPSGARRKMRILAWVLVLIFAAFLLWHMTRATVEAFQDDSLFPTVIPMKLIWIYWIGPIGMLQFVLTAIVMLGDELRRARS